MNAFKVTRRCFGFLVATSMLSACGHGAGSYSILADSQNFHQNSTELNTKIDVLWVIDNSGSMASSQKNLADNFPTFIKHFSDKGYDFQMAVTTTQAYLANPIWNTYYNNTPKPSYYDGLAQDEIARFRDGVAAYGSQVANHSGYYLLTPNTPNLFDNFVINATQGIYGNGDERSLDSMESALTSQLNSGFVRPGAFLAVIILTDEDDFSNPTTKHYESYDKPLTDINHYVSLLDGLTGSTGASRRFNVSTISIPDQACLDQINNGAQKIGNRVREIADATGGIKGNICNNFGDELDLISNQIVKLSTQFYLGSKKPIPSSIQVSVDNLSYPEASSNPQGDGGWTYSPEANSIVFSGNYIPAQSANIQVSFDPESVTF